MKRIKYISVFDLDANKEQNRLNTLSSTNKVNYIIKVLNNLGYGVDVISTSHTMNNKCYGGKLLTWGDNTLKLFPTTWRGGAIKKILNLAVMHFCIFFYLLFHLSRKDTVIMYHSTGLLWVNVLFMIKKVHLIEECEEIYGDIYGKKWMSYLEKKILTKADAYIYPTYLLNSIVNTKNKPFLVVHGAYKDVGAECFEDSNKEVVEFSPDFYHVAYTGILDSKKGCIDVIRAAQFLDENYYIHILGFGGDEEIEITKKEIERVRKLTKCKLSYDGLRKGADYTNYLKHLDLGVCALDTDYQFINTQFPSKIISYMSAGIPVLCSEARAILTSDVSEALFFYKGNESQNIAEGIISVREHGKVDSLQLLSDCDKKFRKEILKLVNI